MYSPEPQWYRDAVIYEVHVRAFYDSVGDGHGDFGGLTQKLDYLQDLGITAIWLLPFYPSPLRDDGYDIADYTSIHPQYGTLDSFREFLEAAHARGLNVITELVLNHTSDQHLWFQRARRSPPGSPERDFYVWSDSPEKYRDARIIFKDFEPSNWTYDLLAKAYYWHRFYSHQPDLNFDSPEVWKAIFPVIDLWLEMGVDGLRLDAVPYLYEREGTNCENLPETHRFLKALRAHVDERFPNRMLLAEANQWPEDAVAYFGDGDECHMCFHFPLMPRLFMGIQREDRFPVVDIMDQTPAIPESCQWAVFLRNHDELTLEMVTDEERDYMYRSYTRETRARINLGIRHRLAPLLGNNRRRIELMNSLLFSLPGSPVIYYGDEIGMGDNIYLGDRNGVRTPMQWSSDRNAGFSRANPHKLYLPVNIDPEYHYESVNVEAQQNNPQSLLWWMKRLIDVRRQHKAFSRGKLEFLQPDNRRILAFLRSDGDESLLVVANMSRYVQFVELDLSRYQGLTPVELFGRTPFPTVGSLPYLLTLGPHSFYWFLLTRAAASSGSSTFPLGIVWTPELRIKGAWERLLHEDAEQLEEVLPGFLGRRWSLRSDDGVNRAWLRDTIRFGLPATGPGDTATGRDPVTGTGDTGTGPGDTVRFAAEPLSLELALVEFEVSSGSRLATVVPLTVAAGSQAQDLKEHHSERIVARLRDHGLGGSGSGPGQACPDSILCDVTTDASTARLILDAFRQERRLTTREKGELRFRKLPPFDDLLGPADDATSLLDKSAPLTVKTDQFNTSIQFGTRAIWKLYRLVEEGPHPEVELGQRLGQGGRFPHAPALIGVLEYRKTRGPNMVWGVLHAYVPFETDALQRTLDELSDYFERVLTQSEAPPSCQPRLMSLLAGIDEPPGDGVRNLLGDYLEDTVLLGRRTAEMHAALAATPEDPEFAPERISTLYQRSLYQSMRSLRLDVLDRLRRSLAGLPAPLRERGQALLDRSGELNRSFRTLLGAQLDGLRIRCHGDYHLGQVLHTGKDFVIIDFEGRVRTPLGERRIKRPPLRDMASMLRSFDYAVRASLLGLQSGRGRTPGAIRAEDVSRLGEWCRCWTSWVSTTFVRGYLDTCQSLEFVPASAAAWPILLRVFLLEKSLLDLEHELRFRPSWIEVPLSSILDSLDELAKD